LLVGKCPELLSESMEPRQGLDRQCLQIYTAD